MSSSKQVAIVTGGGTGVGRATSLALARRGYNVMINYSRSRDEALQTVADIKQLGVDARAMLADGRGDGFRLGPD